MRETNEELKGFTISRESAIISKEWKKDRTCGKKMKKYGDLCEVEKQQYEEALQTPRRSYGEDRRNYRNIVSRRWREIKEDLARLSAYNDRVRQMKNEAGGDLLVGSMERQTVTENPVVTKPTKTAPKSAKVPSVCWCRLRWLRRWGWRGTTPKSAKVPRACQNGIKCLRSWQDYGKKNTETAQNSNPRQGSCSKTASPSWLKQTQGIHTLRLPQGTLLLIQ